jgi:hypothetical protein
MAGAWLNWLLEPTGNDVTRIFRHYFTELERRIAIRKRRLG